LRFTVFFKTKTYLYWKRIKFFEMPSKSLGEYYSELRKSTIGRNEFEEHRVEKKRVQINQAYSTHMNRMIALLLLFFVLLVVLWLFIYILWPVIQEFASTIDSFLQKFDFKMLAK